jgi:hypothetical protein
LGPTLHPASIAQSTAKGAAQIATDAMRVCGFDLFMADSISIGC